MQFSITGVSLSLASDAVKDGIKDTLCTKSLAAAGVSATATGAGCVAVLAAGSIVGTTTVTAPAGQNLGDVRTPPVAAVLSSLNAIEGIADAVQPGQTMGVAPIQASIIRAGETSPQTVAEPTPPSPPPTAPSPSATTAESEDTDNAFGVVPMLFLPLMLAQFV
jgi:hypothetical protein